MHVPIRTMDPREDKERKEVAENEKNEKGASKWLLGASALRPGLMAARLQQLEQPCRKPAAA